MIKLKYSDTVDYALNTLRFIREKAGISGNRYLSLYDVIDFLRFNFSYSQIIEIGKYLETRGWAKILYLIGDIKAQITASGIVHLESKGNEFEAQYEEYIRHEVGKNNTQLDFLVFGDGNRDSKQRVYSHIEEILAKIAKKEGRETDSYNDIEIVKLEVQKNNPDLRLIEMKLNQLNNISYLADDIQELRDYILTTNNYTY